jgi:hypothetical protein
VDLVTKAEVFWMLGSLLRTDASVSDSPPAPFLHSVAGRESPGSMMKKTGPAPTNQAKKGTIVPLLVHIKRMNGRGVQGVSRQVLAFAPFLLTSKRYPLKIPEMSQKQESQARGAVVLRLLVRAKRTYTCKFQQPHELVAQS